MYDVFVIGSGVAGQTAALGCANAGLKVAIADNQAYGGTCANRGCDSKKVLLTASEIVARASRLKGKGLRSVPEIDWADLQKFKKTFTYNVPAGTEKKLKEAGIDLFHQSPAFIDKHKVLVEGKEIASRYFVIATGLVPMTLNVEGNELMMTSDDFLALDTLPESAVFIGAGYIGMEFSHLLSVLGCEVTVIEKSTGILSNFDQDLADLVRKKSESMGIRFILEADVEKVEELIKNKRVHYHHQDKQRQVDVEAVFNTSGRIPAVELLLLDKAGVEASEAGVLVNSYLQSKSQANVYACGDVASGAMPLTPLSGRQGHIVAENIINGNYLESDAPVIPSAVFTHPNLASVGYSEKEARERYKAIAVKYGEVADWYNAQRQGEDLYAYKILLNQRTEEIVGAHLVGPDASETINLFAMAIANNMTAAAFKNLIFTYPTLGHDTLSMLD